MSILQSSLPRLSIGRAAEPSRQLSGVFAVLPGLVLCGSVTLVAFGLAAVERSVFGRDWLEPLVLAILCGTLVRSVWAPPSLWRPGIAFGAKMVLEVAIVLLGASVSVGALAAVGPALVLGIAALVALAILGSFAFCRFLGLPRHMAILVACGNSICGNSAIAAIAPVIGADSEDVACAIAFTAVLGVGVVLGLPLLVPLVGFNPMQFGVFAGLTVYAVPQVLAATAPVGGVAMHIGTLVKLVRVLMLGPVAMVLSLSMGRSGARRIPLHALVPWFILAFLGMAALHSLDLIPPPVVGAADGAASVLTILSMAALGLGVDIRTVAKAGARVTAAVVGSLTILGVLGFSLIRLLGVG